MEYLSHWKLTMTSLAFWIVLLSQIHGSCAEVGKMSTIPKHPQTQSTNEVQAFPDEEKNNLPVFTMNYPRIQVPLEITLWVLLASFAKIGFHVYHKITIWIPESCLLISIGLIVGGIMYSVKEVPPAVLSSNAFFLYMLPPIVLDSGYFMPTRPFFQNIGTVLWFAVIGTLWNSIGIGISLYAICQIEAFGIQDINLQENLLFGAIISAVDPVAVLTVFEDINVNEQLYIVVFGECLFNDAVTVALYNMLTFVAEMPEVESIDVFLGFGRFFIVGLGGVLFGFLFGFVAAFTTRFTTNVKEIEPLFVFMYSYLAYLIAELFSLSSIMAIVTCAVTMKYYVEENVSQRSCSTVRHVIKMFGTVSETLIFFFLGVVTITSDHEWNWAYICFTIFFCFFWRGIGVLVLTQIINPFRTIPFNFKDQFGLAYGGLRGAVCFALVFLLPHSIGRRNLFLTATIAVILFTVFIQGITIRPLIEYMNVRRTNRKLNTINFEIHSRVMEHTIVGIEDLCGQWSHYYWKDKFKRFNDRFLRKILIRENKAESSIVALYKKLELQNAMELLDTTGDISAAPSMTSLQDPKPPKPKTFLPDELRKMHELLSKNMYKIHERTIAYTNKRALPDDSKTKEILIRRHLSLRRSMRGGSFRRTEVDRPQKFFSLPTGQSLHSQLKHRKPSFTGSNAESEIDYPSARPTALPRRVQPGRTLSHAGAMMPLRRLDTLTEAADYSSSSQVEVINEGGSRRNKGAYRQGSSVSDSMVHVPRWRFGPPADRASNANEDQEEEDPRPPAGWTPEPHSRRDRGADNPLLRRPRDPYNH